MSCTGSVVVLVKPYFEGSAQDALSQAVNIEYLNLDSQGVLELNRLALQNRIEALCQQVESLDLRRGKCVRNREIAQWRQVGNDELLAPAWASAVISAAMFSAGMKGLV